MLVLCLKQILNDESNEINPNPNWSYIPDYLYRILIICGSGSGKTNALLT